MPDRTSPPPGVRRRLADARATLVGTKGLRRRLARQAAAVDALRERLDEQQQRSERQDRRLEGLETQLKALGRASTLDTVERERRDAQIGTLELRLADLEQRLADTRAGVGELPAGDDEV